VNHELTVAATEASLAQIRSWVAQVVDANVAVADVQTRLVLAVHEIAANIVEHAYAGDAGHHLTVTIAATPRSVVARVDHAGSPCNPAALVAPAFDGTRSRGFGLWLAAQACTNVTFTSTGTNFHSVHLTIQLTDKAAS
jgi:serine/threonine-protein kinase RsbW